MIVALQITLDRLLGKRCLEDWSYLVQDTLLYLEVNAAESCVNKK